jgi:hypothetical protein
MSFDIRLVDGDIQLGGNGDVDRVVDSDKLAQDVIKLLNTTIGSDPLNPNYGSTLTSSDIGQAIASPTNMAAQAQIVIAQGLDQLIAIQGLQRSIQTVTDAETILDFDTPVVELDPIEPRQFNIRVNAISRDLTPITVAFIVRF